MTVVNKELMQVLDDICKTLALLSTDDTDAWDTPEEGKDFLRGVKAYNKLTSSVARCMLNILEEQLPLFEKALDDGHKRV